MENAKSLQLQVSYLDPLRLKASAYNPRKWTEKQKQDLKQSIRKFGFADPIIANKAKGRMNIVIGGHFRLEVAKELGLKKVPVVYLDLSLQKERELNLRLNRNNGEWDYELLKEFDIDLLLDVGFDDSDLSGIWDDILSTEDDQFDVVSEMEKIKKPKAREGDLYQLGTHRLICGDATDPTVVQTLVGDHVIDMTYCDPPYNIDLDYDKGVGTKGKYGGTKVDDSKTDEAYRKFLLSVVANALKISNKKCHIFFYCDQKYVGMLQSIYHSLKLNYKRTCLWIKNNSNVTPQIAFNKVYEPCVYGVRGKPYLSPKLNHFNEILNKEVTTGNRVIEDILDLFDIWLVKRLPTNEYSHPTQKPVTLHEKPLRRCTMPGDKVLDLFGGSGSTLIACEQMKRVCFTAEIDPIFVDLIIKRYENLTGERAKKLN